MSTPAHTYTHIKVIFPLSGTPLLLWLLIITLIFKDFCNSRNSWGFTWRGGAWAHLAGLFVFDWQPLQLLKKSHWVTPPAPHFFSSSGLLPLLVPLLLLVFFFFSALRPFILTSLSSGSLPSTPAAGSATTRSEDVTSGKTFQNKTSFGKVPVIFKIMCTFVTSKEFTLLNS